jgi:hypothetical protein
VRIPAVAASFVLLAACGSEMVQPSQMTQSGPDEALVADAVSYWSSVIGVPVVTIATDTLPRVLFREGTDGLAATSAGRGGVDGVDAANGATSGLIVIRPGNRVLRLYRHEVGHALGFFDHSEAGLMAAGSGPDAVTDRERRMMVALYSLDAGTRVETDGTWVGPQGNSGQLDAETARDVLQFNANAISGSSARRLGVTCRWASPVRVFVRR